ncbi:MAG: 2OG-Fe(II) oxygenase [Rhodospirillales bacterium]|nr:MAG: 2OG-Fe(II) oxygenase [Rhodospirillales bacterium]
MVKKPGFGEPAPGFTAPTPVNPKFHFDTAAGRNIVLAFLGHPLTDDAARLVAEVRAERAAFDDETLALFYVLSDPADAARLGVAHEVPGLRYFMDYDRAVAAAYGRCDPAVGPGAPVEGGLVVMDRGLRVLQSLPLGGDRPPLSRLVQGLRRLTDWQAADASVGHAPVLVVERVFEPAFCRRLIDYYAARGGDDSGFMRETEGITVGVVDHGFKRRRDRQIDDDRLVKEAIRRITGRLLPSIRRAFQFEATRIERHIVACYDAIEGGFFRPHRDNTTKGTAHRRFAVTLNLNAEEYEGGDLRLPEFGPRTYRAPTGGAVVFSCSLLHEARPVTRGTRYAYLPFLYTDADAELRERNKAFLDARSGGRAGLPAQTPDDTMGGGASEG